MTPVQVTSNGPGGIRGCGLDRPRVKAGFGSMRVTVALGSARDRYSATRPGLRSSGSRSSGPPAVGDSGEERRPTSSAAAVIPKPPSLGDAVQVTRGAQVDPPAGDGRGSEDLLAEVVDRHLFELRPGLE